MQNNISIDWVTNIYELRQIAYMLGLRKLKFSISTLNKKELVDLVNEYIYINFDISEYEFDISNISFKTLVYICKLYNIQYSSNDRRGFLKKKDIINNITNSCVKLYIHYRCDPIIYKPSRYHRFNFIKKLI